LNKDLPKMSDNINDKFKLINHKFLNLKAADSAFNSPTESKKFDLRTDPIEQFKNINDSKNVENNRHSFRLKINQNTSSQNNTFLNENNSYLTEQNITFDENYSNHFNNFPDSLDQKNLYENNFCGNNSYQEYPYKDFSCSSTDFFKNDDSGNFLNSNYSEMNGFDEEEKKNISDFLKKLEKDTIEQQNRKSVEEKNGSKEVRNNMQSLKGFKLCMPQIPTVKKFGKF
jgi:hypothetical protein